MRLSGLVAVFTILTVPLLAEQSDLTDWQYDAVAPDHLADTAPAAADINAINDLLAKMIKCWNAHDLTGYLSVLWNSPQLMVVLDNEQFQGWDAVNTALNRDGFSDPNKMGQVQPLRTKIRITKPGLALVHDEWLVQNPNENKQIVGSSTMTVQKLDGAWQIISSYSRFSPATSRGWEYDSIAPEQSAAAPSSERDELKAINDLLAKMDACWNARDIDGVMSAYWDSPHLLVVVQEEQVQGWQVLNQAYKTGYPDPNAMGHVEPSRVQIRLLKSDVAFAINWWTITYPKSKVRVIGNTTMNLQKFDQGWKIIMAHSSFAEP